MPFASLPDGDNTLIIYVAGDNGPSAEGSLDRHDNNMMTQNGVGPTTSPTQLPVIDELGGRSTTTTIRSAGPGRARRPSSG